MVEETKKEKEIKMTSISLEGVDFNKYISSDFTQKLSKNFNEFEGFALALVVKYDNNKDVVMLTNNPVKNGNIVEISSPNEEILKKMAELIDSN